MSNWCINGLSPHGRISEIAGRRPTVWDQRRIILSAEDEEMLFAMRDAGKGYGNIADELGVSSDWVKNYLKKKGRL